MAKKTLKCPKCDRSFSMPAHLARHLTSTHASPQAKAAAKKKRAAKKKAGTKKKKAGAKKKRGAKKAKKKVKRGKAARAGRPKGIVSRLGLNNMSLEHLGELIAVARTQARRRLADIQKALK